MKLRAITLAMGALALGLSAPVHAWRDISDDEKCQLAMGWELGTIMVISKSKATDGDIFSGKLMEDGVSIYLTNPDWESLELDAENPQFAEFRLRFEDEHGNWFEDHPIVGNNSLFLRSELEWLTNFEDSRSVLITRDGQKIGTFNWSGFWYPWTQFQRCIREARAPIIEQERQERIRRETPKDPFAPN